MHAVTQSCVLFLWLHTLTLVETQDCTLKKFLSSDLNDANFDTTNLEASYPSGRQVRVGCKVGYSGFFKLICVAGTWDSKGTKCQPRSCGNPGDAQFADFHLDKGEDFVFGSQVVYTCHKGYQMVSRNNVRRCMAEGWDGAVPVCEAQQCPVIHVDNNVQVAGDPEEATYGNVVRFSCKSRSEILFGSSEIYCNEYGEWSDSAPKCKEIKCPVPEIENGYVPGDVREYKEDEVLHFLCNSKYTSLEKRPSKCTKFGDRAEWSPTPLCEPIRCRLNLPALEGTSYDPPFRNAFFPGETLRVTCEKKYWIVKTQYTTTETTCKEDGEWSIRPICQEVVCSNPREPSVEWHGRWWYRFTLGDTVRYTCISNYKSTDGSNLAKCTRDGWRPDPLCKEITCDQVDIQHAVIRNHRKQIYKKNEWARYDCTEGYRGNPTRKCGENGWIGDSECTEIACDRKTFNNAGIVENDKSVYRHKENVKYACKNGYEGQFSLTCEAQGWIGESQCRPIQCKKPDINNALIESNSREPYHQDDQVQYICRNDREKKFTITCKQGVWTGIQVCTGCPKAEIPNGFAFIANNSKLYYTCNEGYKLFTNGWWNEAVCINNLWHGLRICIENMKCGETPDIPNGKVIAADTAYEENATVQITCEEGFQAQVDSLTCRNGNWSSDGGPLKDVCTPKGKSCNAPPKVDNAVILTPYKKQYLSDSIVTYECRDKYSVEGNATLQCRDGNWEKKDIRCTRHVVELTSDSHYDKLNEETVVLTKPTENKESGNATYVDGKWNKTMEREAPAQK